MLMILSLLQVPIVSAAPVHLSGVSGSSACLAVLLSIFSLLSLLLISKRIYLKARKSRRLSPLTEKSDLPIRSGLTFSSSTAQDKSVRAALLVGFFGSPAWETSITNLGDKAKSVDSHFSFDSYQRYNSCQSKSSRTPYSSLSNSGSIVCGNSCSPSMSIADDLHSSCKASHKTTTSGQGKKWTPKLPTRPSLIYDASLSMTTPRRFSMPNVSRKDVNSLGRIRRASSQSVSTTIGHADFSVSSLVGNPSLRLVQTMNNPDHPLPLSSIQAGQCFSTRNSLSMPPNPSGHIRVLQHLPDVHDKSVRDQRRISHPFALTSSPTYISSKSSSETNHKSPICMEMKNEQSDQVDQIPVPNPLCLSPVLLSVDLSPLSVPCPPAASPRCSASGSSAQFLREKNFVFRKIKQKQSRKSSLRPRRSPALGPSPLRAMILPDPSDPKIAVHVSPSRAGSQTCSYSHSYSSLGLGFPSSPLSLVRDSEVEEVKLSRNRETVQMESEVHRATVDEEDTNTLVGMIRELVEETDRWDASLFKDKHFKAMINNSKQALKGSSNHSLVRDSLYHSSETVEDESCEVDLGFLGLDIFRNGGETLTPIIEDKGDHMIVV